MGRLVQDHALQRLPRLRLLCYLSHHRPYAPLNPPQPQVKLTPSPPAVCFFLGILFASFPYDYPLLWSTDPLPPSYLPHLEAHLRLMHQAPPLIARLLHIVVFLGFLGFFTKLFRPSESNVLFDGASLLLYVIGVGVYVANIVKGMRAVSAGAWDDEEAVKAAAAAAVGGETVLGKEDSLRVLSASNTILALVLVGVLVLQVGQWYAEKREAGEEEEMEREEAAAAAAAGGRKKI